MQHLILPIQEVSLETYRALSVLLVLVSTYWVSKCRQVSTVEVLLEFKMYWKTLQLKPKDEIDFPVEALPHFSAFVVKFLNPSLSHVVSSWCRFTCSESCPSQYSSLCTYSTCCSFICRLSDDLPVILAVLPTLPVSDWPTDSFHCLLSLQVYPRRSIPAVDRLCVGVPAAEVSAAASCSLRWQHCW